MKILVAFASTYGSTAEIARRIAATLVERGVDAEARSVTEATGVGSYDAFVVGSAVFAGRWMDQALAFIDRNANILSAHPTWLFSSGPVGKSATKYEPQDAKDAARVDRVIRPREHRIFAGAWDRANADRVPRRFVERFVAKHLLPEGDFRDWDAIDRWAWHIADELRSVAAPAH